jgi:hypothetical protein
MDEYAAALEHAASLVPNSDLERYVRATSRKDLQRQADASISGPAVRPINPGLYTAAGFGEPPAQPERVVAALSGLAEVLNRQADELLGLANDLDQHPARRFVEHAPRILRALCRYELARTLRRAGPVQRASEQLVTELLQRRLAPVLRELVAAIVRFEWYFNPLDVPEAGRKIVFGGLATCQPDLDVRLVINAAERSVLGVAWFLALHLLQPEDHRRVLVLDDPTAAFDITNSAGFISTLRAFVRLTRPAQVVLATHDDALAAILAEELAPVDGWPSGVSRFRCQRDGDDASFARLEWLAEDSRAVADEAALLGLEGGAKLFS